MQNQATYYATLSVKGYHPFGMPMPGRHKPAQSGDEYRYGFQGSEKDFEIAEGDYTTHYRMLDTRIGRWWTVDPVDKPWEGSFAWNSNNPISYPDPSGSDSITVDNGGYIKSVSQTEGFHLFYTTKGELFSFNDESEETQKQIEETILPSKSVRYDFDYKGFKMKVYNRISDGKIIEYMDEAEVEDIGYRLLKQWGRGTGLYDFMPSLYYDYSKGDGVMENGRRSIEPDDFSGPFFVFGNQKTLYNLYDAGNFLTGKAYQLSNVNWGTLKAGTELYHWRQGGDAQADIDALKNGYYYKLKYTPKLVPSTGF